MSPFRRALLILSVFIVATAWIGVACAPQVAVDPEPTVVPMTVAEPVQVEEP